jgi:tetratricopeptide (TPR) repeat protein
LPEPVRPRGARAPRELDLDAPLPAAPVRRGGAREIDFEPPLPSPASGLAAPAAEAGLSDFGELDLPIHASEGNTYATSDSVGASAPAIKTASFGTFDFDASKAPEPHAPASSPGPDALEEDLAALGTHGSSVDAGVRSAAAEVSPVGGRRKAKRAVMAGALAGVLVGGVALHTTRYGAFGYRFVDEAAHRAAYATALADARAKTLELLGRDDDASARAATQAIDEVAARVPRATRIPAYRALIEALVDMRFGVDIASKQGNAWRPGEWEEERSSVERLAVAAGALARGQTQQAQGAFDDAVARGARDEFPEETAALAVEMGLVRNDVSRAVVESERIGDWGVRGPFSRARALLAGGNVAEARQVLERVTAASPEHAGALVRLARIAHEVSHDGGAALALVDRVLSEKRAVPASTSERSLAFAVRGLVFEGRGLLGEARNAYAEALRLWPSNAMALMGQGEIVYSEGRYAEALARFDAAVQIEPRNTLAIVGKAKAMMGLERLADAKAVLDAARQQFPNEMRIVYWLANVERALGAFVEAERDFVAAIAMVDPAAPDASAPYLGLSLLLAAQDRTSEAKERLAEARSKLPDSAAMARAFGEVALAEGRYADAIDDFRRSLEKDERDVSARFRFAVALRRGRRFDEAATEFDAVASADKDFPGLALERGLMFEQAGKVEQALAQFEGALKKAPDDPDLQLRVASMYVVVGRFDDGLAILKRVVQVRPNSAEAAHFTGRALFGKSRGNTEPEALRNLKRAAELDKNRAEFHLYYAWAANEATPPQLDLARSEIDVALRLDRLLPEAYWQRAVVLRRLTAVDDALDDVQRSLTLKPSLVEAQATLAECLEDRKEFAKAKEAWKRAVDAPRALPEWHFRYGRLLAEERRAKDAVEHVVFAATEGAKRQGKPGWLLQANFLAAELLVGAKRASEARPFLERFLEGAPRQDPDRSAAEKMLAGLR